MNRAFSMLVNILSLGILVSSLLLIGTTSSQGEYDQWVDLNDDGYINGKDAIILGTRFGTSGTPLNKTELLLELQAKIVLLNASLSELQTRVGILNATKLGMPDYDTGWTDFNLSQNAVINHGLNTTHLLWYGLRETGTYGTIMLVRIISENAIEFRRTYQWDFHTVRILLWKIPES